MSYIDTTRLPYFEVQRMVPGPVAPSRAIPRGMTQTLGLLSLCQSIERPVITWFAGPTQVTREQARAAGVVAPSPKAVRAAAAAALSKRGGVAMEDRGALLNCVHGHCFCPQVDFGGLIRLDCCQELLPHLRLRLARIGGLACLSALASASLAALPAATAAAKPAPSQPAAASAPTPLGRLGPLPLDNGYPTPATAQKLYDELDAQRATHAYLWPLPAVGFKALYDAQAKTMGVRNGEAWAVQLSLRW